MEKLSVELYFELCNKVYFLFSIVSYGFNWFVRGYVGLKLKQAQAPHLMKIYCLSLLNILVSQGC